MQDLVERLASLLLEKNMMMSVAESCTGGLLCAALTHGPGASKFFDRGFITYSNDAKAEMLGLSQEMIRLHGAVSAEVAESMARGALEHSRSSLAVSITGVAGPDGGTPEKPVGLVYFGYALKGGSSGSVKENFTGSRAAIQTQAAARAVKHVLSVLEK